MASSCLSGRRIVCRTEDEVECHHRVIVVKTKGEIVDETIKEEQMRREGLEGD